MKIQFILLGQLILVLFGASYAGTAIQNVPQPTGRVEGSSGESVTFTKDGKKLLTSGNGSARLWDARSLQPLLPPLEHGSKLRGAILSPNEEFAATFGGNDVRIWELQHGHLVRAIHHSDVVNATCFTPDSAQVITGSHDARIWDVASGRVKVLLKEDANVGFVCCSRDGTKVLTLSDARNNGEASIWDSSTGRKRVTLQDEAHYDTTTRNIAPAAFDSTGHLVATISFKAVCIWDADTAERLAASQVWREEELGEPSSLVFSEDGRSLLVAKEGGLMLISVPRGRVLVEIKDGLPAGPVEVATFARSEHWIVASSKYDGSGIWDRKSGKKLFAFPPPDPPHEFRNFNSIPAIGCDSTGSRLAAGWKGGNFTAVWNVQVP